MPMTEEVLDHTDINALFQKMRGKAVAQGVNGYIVIEPRSIGRSAKDALQLARRDGMLAACARKQPMSGLGVRPVGSEQVEKLIR